MNVQTFKTLNGDEIVADVSSISNGVITAENVVVMQMMQHPQSGEMMRAFGDWPALAAPGQTLQIPLTALLVYPCAPHEEITRQYTANVTGLDLPPVTPKIILG